MNNIKFMRGGVTVIRKINQIRPIKRGNYRFGAWTDSSVETKARMLRAGYAITGKRQS